MSTRHPRAVIEVFHEGSVAATLRLVEFRFRITCRQANALVIAQGVAACHGLDDVKYPGWGMIHSFVIKAVNEADLQLWAAKEGGTLVVVHTGLTSPPERVWHAIIWKLCPFLCPDGCAAAGFCYFVSRALACAHITLGLTRTVILVAGNILVRYLIDAHRSKPVSDPIWCFAPWRITAHYCCAAVLFLHPVAIRARKLSFFVTQPIGGLGAYLRALCWQHG